MNKSLSSDVKFDSYDTICCSGGSSTGFILLGALQYHFETHCFGTVLNYVGTSVGSIIVYLLAIGFSPMEIMIHLCTNDFLEKLSGLNIANLYNNQGVIAWHPLHAELEKITIEKIGFLPTMADISKKYRKNLVLTTYNISENRGEYLSHTNYPHLPCLTAVRMSANLPLIFDHFKYNNCFYIDGGITDNFAITHAQSLGNRVLGISLTSPNLSELPTSISEMNTLEFVYKILWVPINEALQLRVKSCLGSSDIITLKSPFERKVFDFNVPSVDKMNMFSFGYQNIKEWRDRGYVSPPDSPIIPESQTGDRINPPLSLPSDIHNIRISTEQNTGP